MAKRKTLVQDFEELVKAGNEEEIKAVFTKCDINAYGGYNKGNALEFLLSAEMMKWLIEQGADIEYVDSFGYTPLLYHAGHGFAEEQAINLVRLGADIHVQHRMYKSTPLHQAVSAGSLELIKCLLEAGADVSVVDWNGDTPLECAFHKAQNFDLIKLEPVAKYLLSQGVNVSEKLQGYLRERAQDIEFRRKDINPDSIGQLDAVLDSLYTLFHVEPVPKRVEFDGKSRIILQEKTWQKQHGELWKLLVPGSGHASTVQGEVIRITGKIAYEILDNGAMNWDKEYVKLSKAFLNYMNMGNELTKEKSKELTKIVKSIKKADEKEIDRMTELAVEWVLLNLDPIPLENVAYKR